MVSPALLGAWCAQLSRDTTQSSWTAPSKGFVHLHGHLSPGGATNYFYSLLLPSCLHLIKLKVGQTTGGLHVDAFRHPRPESPWVSDHVIFMKITTWFQQYPATLSYLDRLLHGSCCSFTSRLNLPTSLIICLFSVYYCLVILARWII